MRPTVYGFYRTQWRRWPGEGVVPVSNEQAATPVAPPEVQVPGPDEESPRAPADVEPPAEDDAEAPAAAERPDRQPPSEMPPADPTRENPDDAAPPANNPSGAAESSPVPPTPPGEPPIPPAGEDPVPGPLDRSAVPDGEGDVVTEVGAMRYPGQVGRSIATGAAPWRLGSAGSQRAVDSARGL